MKKAMLAKFTQDHKAKYTLVETGENILMEATYDKFWGTGRRITDPQVFNRNFPGSNICGKLLMNTRATLLKGKVSHHKDQAE